MNNEKIAIVCPCFNESRTVICFLQELNAVLSTLPGNFIVIVIDDASTDDTLELLKAFKFNAFHVSLTILSLKNNAGHQQAIYQGMLYANTLDFSHVIVMDSDGEDDPAAISELLRLKNCDIVHVNRGSRKESFVFRLFYFMYKILFRLLTRRSMSYGNFCMINREMLCKIVQNSFYHLAAFLSKQQVNTAFVLSDKRKRIDGRSKMSGFNLLTHAFRSFAEFSEPIFKRVLKLLIYILVFLIIQLIIIRVYRNWIGFWNILEMIRYDFLLLYFAGFIIVILITGKVLMNFLNLKRNDRKKTFYEKIG